jgi:probable phosphoglycerate mutase
MNAPQSVKFPGGETLDDVKARAMSGLDRIADAHPDETVLVATHRVVCKVILCAALGLENSHFWQIQQDTCCINRLRFSRNGIYIVEMVNDTCHLAALRPAGQPRDF